MNETQLLVQRLGQLESAVVADVMDAMGLEHQVLAPGMLAVRPGSKMAGPAICAAGSEKAGTDALPTFGLDASVYPGGIVVIDTGGCERGAVIGDNMVASMVGRGARGFIVDGGIRDSADFLSLEEPVFCRYHSPLNAHKYWHFTAFEEPITLRGIRADVTVHPGDLLLADSDGIAVLPRQHAEQIIADGEVHMQTENGIKQALLAGGDREAVTRAAGRLQHIKPLPR
ncbi:RraA family protein [Parahaliea maris]|uniref:Putative 4-hydroxy-4-methyl-2-oxoglutarate aldolase n=1 Tax=Parahaliea maris TaxID=2716870 RepID=A0A5C8ZP68_9GAMM|nr:RraA family protein [Parahaliea maris]TXS89510.1 RraA family protein [Parahaliea maris]